MKRLLLLLLFLPSLVSAQGNPNFPADITFTWTWPTEYTDDSLILPGDLSHAVINCTNENGATVVDVQVPIVTPLGSPQTELVTGVIPAPGTYTCVSYNVTVLGVSSDLSNTDVVTYTGSGKAKPNTGFGVS